MSSFHDWHEKLRRDRIECCFTKGMTISGAFRHILSKMAIVDKLPLVPKLPTCLETRGDGSRAVVKSVCTFRTSPGR
jgi:hypothetical protein